jgi:hypothetical protein
MSAYAIVSDLYVHGAPASAFGSLTDADKLASIVGASGDLDAVISSQGDVPLVAWGEDVRKKIVHLATYDLLCRVGFNPNAGADVNYRLRADDARAWLRDIGKGVVRPRVTFATARATKAQPTIRSKPQRGW